MPLLAWEREFAEWLATCHRRPPRHLQVTKARELSGDDVKPSQVRALRERRTFVDYLDKLSQDAITQARAKYEARLPEYIDADYEGLQMALEREDYRALTQYTTRAIDRVMPRQDLNTQITAVKIELTPAQMQDVDSEYIPVEVERLSDDTV